MKVISVFGRGNFRLKNFFLAIGVFDGVHRGHQMLIRQIVKRAQAAGGTSVVITFDPHPVHVLHPEISCPLLIPLRYRLKLIAELGVDVCLVICFTRAFSKLTPQQFIEKYLVQRIHPQEVFVGDDFRFGQNRSGDLEFFKKAAGAYGFKVHGVSPLKGDQKVISSSRIRKLIAEGDLEGARHLLGRRVSVMGKVIKGDGRGQKLGFPTANIDAENCVLPPHGVYVARVLVGKRNLRGIVNIGVRPSFRWQKQKGKTHVEVHILDFHKNIYGEDVVLEFIEKIRDENQFDSVEDLIVQIQMDEKKVRRHPYI